MLAEELSQPKLTGELELLVPSLREVEKGHLGHVIEAKALHELNAPVVLIVLSVGTSRQEQDESEGANTSARAAGSRREICKDPHQSVLSSSIDQTVLF